MNNLVVTPVAYKHLKVNSSLFLATPINDRQAVINGILSLLAFPLCDYPCNGLKQSYDFYPMEISLANKSKVLSYSCIIMNTKSATGDLLIPFWNHLLSSHLQCSNKINHKCIVTDGIY